jgi:hypothetical protein
MSAMTHHLSTRRPHREAAFVAALDAYRDGGDAAAMLRAAAAIIDSKRPIGRELADTISLVTDNLTLTIETYGDAADEIWRWLTFGEPSARH